MNQRSLVVLQVCTAERAVSPAVLELMDDVPSGALFVKVAPSDDHEAEVVESGADMKYVGMSDVHGVDIETGEFDLVAFEVPVFRIKGRLGTFILSNE